MLKVTAELENLTNLQPQNGCDDPNFSYFFKLKCGQSSEITGKETCLTLSEIVQSGIGTFHLVQKCKFCEREGTVTMIPGKGQPLTFEIAESGKYTPLMLFDCRGFEPTDFAFLSLWSVESVWRFYCTYMVHTRKPSKSIQSGPLSVLVLKHVKGRTNEKSKDVTTLDWNVVGL